MVKQKIIFMDQTLREGMQHRGIVFSNKEKQEIFRFQQRLGVDICQAGYPPAHASEKQSVADLQEIAIKEKFDIQVAGMARANPRDVPVLIETGMNHFHLHAHIQPRDDKATQELGLKRITDTVNALRSQRPGAVISMAMLDIGNTPRAFLEQYGDFLINTLAIDILSVPDTSGQMAPNTFHDAVKLMVEKSAGTNTAISVHCHNDLGMATANTVMGVVAGATVVEVSALGIGERNGIGDLFSVGKILKAQNHEMTLKIEETDLFRQYYNHVNAICTRQTGEPLLSWNTPFFGDAVNTHVAGTHADTAFGMGQTEKYYLNVLCGRGLVKKYLTAGQIPFVPETLPQITQTIKDESARRGRRLFDREIRKIAHSQHTQG
jgi:2-isopropylmalate synthase